MPLAFEWDDESHTIILVIVTDDWSLESAYASARDEFPTMLTQTDTVPDLIIDFTDSGKVATTGILKTWQDAFGWLQMQGLSTMLIVMIQAPPLVKSAGGTLRNLRIPIMRNTYFVDTLDDARALIRRLRDDNPRLSLPSDK